MPNGVKYSTTTPSGSLRRDNVALGVNGNLGPTANTGFYSMPAPASGKYIINKVAASGVPLFFAPQSDAELIQFARNEGATGANTGSAAAVLAWIATQANLEAANFEYENIVTDGLIFNVDAGFVGSYPTTASTWYDLSGNNYTGTLINGPTFNSANNGSIVFDGVDDYVALGNQASWNSSNTLTMAAWVNISGIGGTPDIGGIITNQSTGYDFQSMYAQVYPNPSQIYIIYGVSHINPNTEAYVQSVENKNTWLHAVATRYFDGTNTTIKLYINGILKQTSTMSGQQAQTANGWVLGRYYGERAMIGNIAIVQVYSKILSEAEITQNYNAQKSRFLSIVTDGLIMNLNAGNTSSYPGTGTLWTDLSGQNNNATLVNGPAFSSSDGGVITFDGTNDSAQWASDGAITSNLNTWYNDTSRTLQMWIKFSNLTQGLIQSITSVSYDEVQYGFAISNSRWAMFSNGTFSTAGGALSTNTWYFVTLLRTGVSSWTIYQGTTNLGNVTQSAGTPILGEDYQFQLMCNGYGNHKQGTVGQVLFYNKTLSAAEIENNYNSTKARFGL